MFSRDKLILDRHVSPPLASFAFTVYVDNCIVIGADKGMVDMAVIRGRRLVEAAGLPTHEVELATTEAEVLGWKIDGHRRFVLPKAARVWRCYLALSWILSQQLVECFTRRKTRLILSRFSDQLFIS